MVWVRFVRFPPLFEAYEQKLAKQRYFTRSKFAHPESTIRPKGASSRTSPGRARPNGRAAAGTAAGASGSRPGPEWGAHDADRGPPVRGRPSPEGRAARHDRA